MQNKLLTEVNKVRLGGVDRIKYQLRLLLSKFSFRLHRLAMERQEILETIKHLHDDIKYGRLTRTGYVDHYSEQRELEVLERYRKEFTTCSANDSEVVFRAQHVRDIVLSLIREDTALKNVVNFGCSYGWLEHQISNKASSTAVWGIDRSESAMQSNRKEFGSANCNFIASDIFNFIAGQKHALIDSVFCHINIGVYFLPTFIKQLYNAIYAAGGRYIVAFEPSGLSRETNDYYRYSLEASDSVVFRGPMLLNNYPNILRESGFELVSAKIMQPPHPQPDFRSICLVSRRRN